jgi:spore germination protein PD
MIFQVVNKEINVGFVRMVALASSSVFLIGDTRNINMSAVLDTPPEAVSPIVPLPPEE